MQLVLLCVLVFSFLQPGLLQDGRTEDISSNDGEDLSQSITQLQTIAVAQTKLMVDLSREVRGQLATINATVNSLKGQLESLAGEVVKNRQKINGVNKRVQSLQETQLQIVLTTDNISTGVDLMKKEMTVIRESIHEVNRRVGSEQENCQNISLQLARCSTTDQLFTGLGQLKTELTSSQQMISERVGGVSSQQLNIQNETVAQLQIVHTTLSTQLANATDQLSTGLNQLRRELTTSQQSSELEHNMTQVQLGVLHTSLQQQCRQTSLEALQDSLAAHTRQLATVTGQLSTGHQALEDTLTEQLQTVTSDCDNRTAELLHGQESVLKALHGIGEGLGYLYTCGGSPGWRRVAFLNMTDPSQDCPSGWNLTAHPVRTCGRASSERGTCYPVTFPVGGRQYSRVCGRIRAYQYGVALAFSGAYWDRRSLNGSYVDGYSITHGIPRQHIWTFAAGLAQEQYAYAVYQYCHCDVQMHTDSSQAIPPLFVDNDYFCESGVGGRWEGNYRLYSENPLWDGQNCGQNSTCCSVNNPPYFMKDLPAPTTNDIEVRLCASAESRHSDFPVELLEIYM